jgi:hypothetical protein
LHLTWGYRHVKPRIVENGILLNLAGKPFIWFTAA